MKPQPPLSLSIFSEERLDANGARSGCLKSFRDLVFREKGVGV